MSYHSIGCLQSCHRISCVSTSSGNKIFTIANNICTLLMPVYNYGIAIFIYTAILRKEYNVLPGNYTYIRKPYPLRKDNGAEAIIIAAAVYKGTIPKRQEQPAIKRWLSSHTLYIACCCPAALYFIFVREYAHCRETVLATESISAMQ